MPTLLGHLSRRGFLGMLSAACAVRLLPAAANTDTPSPAEICRAWQADYHRWRTELDHDRCIHTPFPNLAPPASRDAGGIATQPAL